MLPIGGIVLFFFPLYYQFVKCPPTYPIKYANWVAIGWVDRRRSCSRSVVVAIARRNGSRDIDRVYVEDETAATPEAACSDASPLA